jgi:hypothetical protein
MERPTKQIEALRNAVASGKIEPLKEYRFDLGNGEIMSFTGTQLLETANAFVAFADAEKRGDAKAMRKAMKRIEQSQ